MNRYKCPECGRRYTIRAALERHRVRAHGAPIAGDDYVPMAPIYGERPQQDPAPSDALDVGASDC